MGAVRLRRWTALASAIFTAGVIVALALFGLIAIVLGAAWWLITHVHYGLTPRH
jgi:hypothetical protein